MQAANLAILSPLARKNQKPPSAVTAKYTMVDLADKETKAPKARLISKATAEVSLTVSISMA
jgi:hypothetical protein